MDVNNRLKVVGFFLTISEWDRHLEVIRQVLNAIETFEPYASYLRLTKGRGTPITATDINDFMKSNGFEGDYMSISLIVRLFDTRFEGSLDFEDYLKMTLSRDNPEIRFSAAQRDNYEVEQGDVLAPEIEYTLARFFFKASEFLSKIMQDPETHLILTQTNLFREIDTRGTGHLDFHNLKSFFEESKIKPRDSEIISILRIIDINDDGKINENEFNFFIELFSGKEPGNHTLNVLKRAHEEDNKINYFGEKTNQDPFKYDREKTGYNRSNAGGNSGTGLRKSGISPSFNAGSRKSANYTSSRPLSNRPSALGGTSNRPGGTGSYSKSRYESKISKDGPSYSRREEYTSTNRSRSPLTGGASRKSYVQEKFSRTSISGSGKSPKNYTSSRSKAGDYVSNNRSAKGGSRVGTSSNYVSRRSSKQ